MNRHGVLSLSAITALGLVLLPCSAVGDGIIRKTFEFGQGSPQVRSHFRTFSVPARSLVGVAVENVTVDRLNVVIPMFIQVRQASAQSIGNTGPHGPELATRFLDAPAGGVNSFQNIGFSSDFGCPSTWRVLVGATGADVPAKVSGTIVFAFTSPGPVELEMSDGGTQHLDPNVTANRTIGPKTGSIAGTGRFHIRAKWHTDPADVLSFGTHSALTVMLMRPDGSLAGSEYGYSQHASRTPKVNFRYTVTAADAAAVGDWKLRIINPSTNRVVDFDINRGLDPNPGLQNFTSTFRARCN